MDKELMAFGTTKAAEMSDSMVKIDTAVKKAVIALQASVEQQIPAETINRFKFHLRKLLSNDDTDGLHFLFKEQAHEYFHGLFATLTSSELSNFFKNILILDEQPPKEKEEIQGRYSVEQPIDWTLSKEIDQDAFWGQAFLTMLLRFNVSIEAFKDRLEDALFIKYPNDAVIRLTIYSEINKVFIDKKLSYSNYLHCAKMLGFTHMKVELI